MTLKGDKCEVFKTRKEDVDDSPRCSKKILQYSLLNGALGKTNEAEDYSAFVKV